MPQLYQHVFLINSVLIFLQTFIVYATFNDETHGQILSGIGILYWQTTKPVNVVVT
jgi:hypothetical protein